jgi:hypothetical protein
MRIALPVLMGENNMRAEGGKAGNGLKAMGYWGEAQEMKAITHGQ